MTTLPSKEAVVSSNNNMSDGPSEVVSSLSLPQEDDSFGCWIDRPLIDNNDAENRKQNNVTATPSTKAATTASNATATALMEDTSPEEALGRPNSFRTRITDEGEELPRGVTVRASGKWQAQIYFMGKSRYIGVFRTKEEAALAYELARTNLAARKDANPAAAEDIMAFARNEAYEGVRRNFPHPHPLIGATFSHREEEEDHLKIVHTISVDIDNNGKGTAASHGAIHSECIKNPKESNNGNNNQKKRKWKKQTHHDSTNNNKPRRPLSAYNLFFQAEREKIISSCIDSSSSLKTKGELSREERQQAGEQTIESVATTINFGCRYNLVRTIAEKWKNLDEPTRSAYKERACRIKDQYMKEVEEWKKLEHGKDKEGEKRSNNNNEGKKKKPYSNFNDTNDENIPPHPLAASSKRLFLVSPSPNKNFTRYYGRENHKNNGDISSSRNFEKRKPLQHSPVRYDDSMSRQDYYFPSPRPRSQQQQYYHVSSRQEECNNYFHHEQQDYDDDNDGLLTTSILSPTKSPRERNFDYESSSSQYYSPTRRPPVAPHHHLSRHYDFSPIADNELSSSSPLRFIPSSTSWSPLPYRHDSKGGGGGMPTTADPPAVANLSFPLFDDYGVGPDKNSLSFASFQPSTTTTATHHRTATTHYHHLDHYPSRPFLSPHRSKNYHRNDRFPRLFRG